MTAISLTPSVKVVTNEEQQSQSNKIAYFGLSSAFYQAVNGNSGNCCLSLAKKVLNIALLIIVPLNLVLLPFIFALNCCRSDAKVGDEKIIAKSSSTSQQSSAEQQSDASLGDLDLPPNPPASPLPKITVIRVEEMNETTAVKAAPAPTARQKVREAWMGFKNLFAKNPFTPEELKTLAEAHRHADLLNAENERLAKPV